MVARASIARGRREAKRREKPTRRTGAPAIPARNLPPAATPCPRSASVWSSHAVPRCSRSRLVALDLLSVRHLLGSHHHDVRDRLSLDILAAVSTACIYPTIGGAVPEPAAGKLPSLALAGLRFARNRSLRRRSTSVQLDGRPRSVATFAAGHIFVQWNDAIRHCLLFKTKPAKSCRRILGALLQGAGATAAAIRRKVDSELDAPDQCSVDSMRQLSTGGL
jgi:hypothetical protein